MISKMACAERNRSAILSTMIYFIQSVDGGPIKIGHTAKSLKSRLASIQTGSPVKLRVLGTIPGDRDTEMALHAALAPFRVMGEWFRVGWSVIKSQCAALGMGHPSGGSAHKSRLAHTRRLLTVKQAAELCGCGEEKIRGLIHRGKLEACNVGSGWARPRYRIHPAALELCFGDRLSAVPFAEHGTCPIQAQES